MPRKPREWWPGAIYHIMCRGNRREDIYHDDEDRRTYLHILRNVQTIHPYTLHAYCLMNNHVHLLLETQETKPGPVMKMINMRYAMFFNKKYDSVGQLLQGRFRSEIVDNERYFLELTRYIHLNPVKAGMAKFPSDYRWSSYREYLGEVTKPLVETGKVLSCLEGKSYKEFVVSGSGNDGEEAMRTVPSKLLLDEMDGGAEYRW